jgi:hypothetical protein
MTAPIIVNNMNGHPVVGGAADVINAALNGARPLTITGNAATGDTVWLAPITKQVWRDDAITVEHASIAHELDHPQFGRVLYAYIDMNRTEQAPQLTTIEAECQARLSAADRAAEKRIAAMVPPCDNCGDCEQCC